MSNRSRFLQGAACATLLVSVLASTQLCAQTYPNRPIRLVVPFPAGGTAEVIARTVASPMEQALGQPIVIDSRGGANGIIGTEIVARSAPDGHTLLHVTASFVINPHIYRKLPYDIEKDFTGVTNLILGQGYLVLVHPSLPTRSLQEFVALAKKDSKLSYGSPGVGNTLHLATELFNVRAGTKLLHVPYKGVAAAMNAVLGGEVQFIIMPPTIANPMLKAGKLRALGVSSPARLPELPDVPTLIEGGLDFQLTGGWHGWFAPAGTPAAIVARVQTEVQKALALPKVKDFLVTGGYAPDGRSPAEAQKFFRAETQRYGEMVRAAKITPQ
jgi:tripartite-type tricarboxylate transporter receptor subunit TctC